MKKMYGKSKKALYLAVALALSLSTFAGCGKKGADNEEKEVSLKWMMPGTGKQADSDEVWEEVNKKLKTYPGLENVSLEFQIVPFSDYKQKFLLQQTSGDTADIAGTYTLNYTDEVKNETFLPLYELIDEYAPDIKKNVPDWALKLMEYNGELYGITNYQMMTEAIYGYGVVEDYFNKYADEDLWNKTFLSNDQFDTATLELFQDYFEKLKANGELGAGMQPGTTWAMKGFEMINGYAYVFRRDEDKIKVEEFSQSEPYKLLCEWAEKFYKKGYIRKDVLSADLSDQKDKKDGYALFLTQCHKGAEEAYENNNNFDIKLFQHTEKFHIPASSGSGGNAILASCENPEKAIKFLELMYSEKGKDLYRLITYGFEGRHYTIDSQNRMEPIGYTGTQGTANSPYGLPKWIVGNTANAFETIYDPVGWNDYVFNDWNVNATKSKIIGFTFDNSGVEKEIMQTTTVREEYLDQLASGALGDWKSTYEEYSQKLKVAGNDKVIAEYQRQIDEFLANQK